MVKDATRDGAEEVMQRLGIDNEDDIKDMREAIAVGRFWRNLRKSFVDSVGKRIAGLLFWCIAFGAVAGVLMLMGKLPGIFGKGL
jgi:hypothetical protein